MVKMNGKRFENRLNKSDIKFNTLNPVWDNEKETALNVFEMIDKLNEYSEKIYELKLHIDELEDDNQKYSLGTGKPVLENPQFKVTGCPYEILDTSNNHYYWLEMQENVKELCKEINKIVSERDLLKKELDTMIKIFEDSGIDYYISDELELVIN